METVVHTDAFPASNQHPILQLPITFDPSEIANWADLPDAFFQLARLILLLVTEDSALPKPSRIDIPTGSSVRMGGWDGILEIEHGNSWVPQGASGWEFSCKKEKIRQKATEDYEKRTMDPKGLDISTTTFLFVTPRRWPGKREWVEETKKNPQDQWADVRVLDADDLVLWLQQVPKATFWLALQIFKPERFLALWNQLQPHTEVSNVSTEYLRIGFNKLAKLNRRSIVTPSVLAEAAKSEPFPDPTFHGVSSKIDTLRDLINDGHISAAESGLERLRNTNEEIPVELEFRIVRNLGMCALAREDIDSACSWLQQAYDLQPETPKGIVSAALAAKLADDIEGAVNLAEKARTLNSNESLAVTILIEGLWEQGKYAELEELISATKDWITDDRHCALALASIREQEKRFEEAIVLYKSLTEEDSEDAVAHLALSLCLLKCVQTGQRNTDGANNLVVQIYHAEAAATRAIDLLKKTQLNVQLLEAHVVRAMIRAFLGETAGAMQDLDLVLQETPTDPYALFHKGMMLLNKGQLAEAHQAFNAIQDPAQKADAFIPLSEAYVSMGDSVSAIELLEGTLNFGCPEWQDIYRAEIFSKAELAAGRSDSVGPVLESALQRQPDNPRLLTLAAMCQRFFKDTKNAEALLNRALEIADTSDHQIILGYLGNFYFDLERYAEAADRFTEAVDNVAVHPNTINLLLSLSNSKRFREALHWVRRIRSVSVQIPRLVAEVEIQIYEYVGDYRSALSVLKAQCSQEDVGPADYVNLAFAHFRNGEQYAAIQTVRSISPTGLLNDPRALLNLAKLKWSLGESCFLEDAYQALRYGINDPVVHLGYFRLFQICESTEPNTVSPGCAVLLQNGAEKFWWHILDDGEEPRHEHDLEPGGDLARHLLGQCPGRTIPLRKGLEDLSYEIVDIQSKYVRAFQDAFGKFSTRFPENMGLSLVEIENNDFTHIFQSVDQRDSFIRKAEQLYEKGGLPFATFATLLGRSPIEVWRAVTEEGSIRICCGTAADKVMQASAKKLVASNIIVLDLTALLTVHELELAPFLRRRFQCVAVSQLVVDEIRNSILAARQNGTVAYIVKSGDGQYKWLPMSEQDFAEQQEYLNSVLDFAETLARIPAYRILDFDGTENLVEVLGGSGVGTVFASGEVEEFDPVLIADDHGLASIARSLTRTVVNTQSLLQELLRSQIITDEDYSDGIERLALLHYEFVNIRPEDIVRRLEANSYVTSSGIRAMLNYLEGPNCTDDSAVSVGVKLVSALVGKAPQGKVLLILSLVLAALRHGRDTEQILFKFRDRLALNLHFRPAARDWLIQSVNLSIQYSKTIEMKQD